VLIQLVRRMGTKIPTASSNSAAIIAHCFKPRGYNKEEINFKRLIDLLFYLW